MPPHPAAARPPRRSLATRPLVFLVGVLGGLLGGLLTGAGSVAAHNTFVSSDPSDGAVLIAAPATMTLTFERDVPLESATVTVIDPAGSRTEAPLAHGPLGATQLVATLPALGAGEITVRWRLVGADGHPITDRIRFRIESAPLAEGGATTVPGAEVPATDVPGASESAAGADPDEEPFRTPDALRWVLRYGSYLAIFAVIGAVAADGLVWYGALRQPLLVRLVDRSLLAVALLAGLQLLVLVGDVTGQAPWASLGSLDAAGSTHAGIAFLVRVVLAVCGWAVLRWMTFSSPAVRWHALGLLGIALLGTWAFAGHSSTRRWPDAGVLLDVAHHGAAAVWVGGLAVLGVAAGRLATDPGLGAIVGRFSRVAAVSVVVLVATGLVQAVRLVGAPTDLFVDDHGRYLAVKLGLVAVMLVVADVNRRRAAQWFRTEQVRESGQAAATLRRTVGLEFVLGLAVLAVTAALVVSPPTAG